MKARKTVLSKEIRVIMCRTAEAIDLAFNMFYLLQETLQRENERQERAVASGVPSAGVSGEGDS